MTEKRCTDCKYTKGIGYDFWCGEGHTEYEVFMGETNCPYYEYHDWSKGTPSETEKRFKHMINRLGMQFICYDDMEILLGTFADKDGINHIVTLLNDLSDENEQLKSENKRLTDKLNKTALELVDECISQGKATEISEMSYREFLDYRAENGKPMELQL